MTAIDHIACSKKAHRLAELERMPFHLRPLLDFMHAGARLHLVSALSNLMLATAESIERNRGIALGMIKAAESRDELSLAASDALHEFVLSIVAKELGGEEKGAPSEQGQTKQTASSIALISDRDEKFSAVEKSIGSIGDIPFEEAFKARYPEDWNTIERSYSIPGLHYGDVGRCVGGKWTLITIEPSPSALLDAQYCDYLRNSPF